MFMVGDGEVRGLIIVVESNWKQLHYEEMSFLCCLCVRLDGLGLVEFSFCTFICLNKNGSLRTPQGWR